MIKHILHLLIGLIFIAEMLYAQIFTSVTEGDLVGDEGYSRGACWVDYDGDGDLDLYVCNGRGEVNFFFENIGDYIFTSVENKNFLNGSRDSQTCTWGDYDNDGYIDFFVANIDGQNHLYKNEGNGIFTEAATDVIGADVAITAAASWIDYDNDGYLDLFCANGYSDNKNFLYHNNGNGSFTKITSGAIVNDVDDSRCCVWADYDNDNDQDLFVANGREQNDRLYVNNGDGSFESIFSGVVVNDGAYSVGASWGDYNNDGYFDLFLCGLSSSFNRFFYHNNGDGTFSLLNKGDLSVGKRYEGHSAYIDYDNDGYLDIFISRGTRSESFYNFLFHNEGDETFLRVYEDPIVLDSTASNSSTWADINYDGFLDVFVSNLYQNNLLYLNNGNNNNWINISCEGTVSNRSAIGARIRVKALINNQSLWQMRQISGQDGFQSQHSLSAEFGLGNASVIDSLVIMWPSGIKQILTDVDVNQFLTIKEPSSTIQIEIPKINAFSGDSVLVPINVKFPVDSSYSSCELNIGGYIGKLELIEIVTDSSLIEYKEWTYQVNETEDEAIIWLAGSEDVSGEGVLFWLHFSLPEGSSGLIPITLISAVFNTEHSGIENISGGVQIFPTLFGDVDLNNQVQAFDASLILKHLVDSIALDTFQLANADVSTDSTVSAYDATLILQYGVGIIDSLPYDTGNGLPKATGMIVMQDQDISMGEVVDIPLSLSEANNIYAFEGIIKFSINHFIYSDMVWSEQFDNFVIEINNTDGEIKFAGASTTPLGQIADFANLRLTIREDVDSDTTQIILEKLRWNEDKINRDVARSKLSIITGINKDEVDVPHKYTLNQNYPNPFNPTTTIGFALPESEFVVLKVYNILGQEAATLIVESLSAGVYNYRWDASNLPSGIYYYQLKAGSYSETKKLILLK